MKTVHIAATVLSALLINGVAVAWDDPGPQGEECPQREPRSFQKPRETQDRMGGQQGQRGQQREFRSQRGYPGMSGHRHGPTPESLKEAGATDEQLAQLKKVKEEQQLKQVDLKAAAEKAQIQLKQLIDSDKPDQDAIFAAVDKVSATKAALMKNGIGAKLKAREILGDELTKKFRELEPPNDRGPRDPGHQHRPRGRADRDRPLSEKADV